MAEFLKMPKAVILPTLEKIEDPEIKKIFEEYNRVFSELVTAMYSDVSWLYEVKIEEGMWTPILEFSGASVGMTYSSQTGLYMKIGNQVTVNGYITLSAKGTSTGEAKITGLPFTCKSGQSSYSYPSFRLQDVKFANVFMGRVLQETTTISLEEITEAGVKTALNNTDFSNSSHIGISVTYFTD